MTADESNPYGPVRTKPVEKQNAATLGSTIWGGFSLCLAYLYV